MKRQATEKNIFSNSIPDKAHISRKINFITERQPKKWEKV